MPTCAVTGATGYVGGRIAAALAGRGWTVRPITRAAGWSIGDVPDLDGVDALVHAAWDFRSGRADANVSGSRALLDAAAGRRIVFVSTLSAFPGARSQYGGAKLAIEEHALRLGGAVVRPGLVWGQPGGSLYAALERLTRLPLLPVFAAEDRKLHLAHEDDLARFVADLVEAEDVPSAPVAAAAGEALSLAATLRRIARARGRRVLILRVPWRPVWLVLRSLERLGIDPPFRSDSVVSLVSLEQDPFGPAGPPAGFRPFAP